MSSETCIVTLNVPSWALASLSRFTPDIDPQLIAQSKTELTPPSSPPSLYPFEKDATEHAYEPSESSQRAHSEPAEDTTSAVERLEGQIASVSAKLEAIRRRRQARRRQQRASRRRSQRPRFNNDREEEHQDITDDKTVKKARKMLEEGERMMRDGLAFIEAGQKIWREGDDRAEKAEKVLRGFGDGMGGAVVETIIEDLDDEDDEI